MGQFRIGVGHPGQRRVIDLGRQPEQHVPDHDAGVVAGDVGELRPAGHVADREDAAVGGAETGVGLDALGRELDAGGFEAEAVDIGLAAGGDQQVRAFDPGRRRRARRRCRCRGARRWRSRRPRADRRLRRSGGRGPRRRGRDRPWAGWLPFCRTVTSAPRRRWACAISMPMGPPPITIRCSGAAFRSKIVSLVRKGTSSRPGMGGWAARDPVASTKRRALIVVPPASTVSGAGEAGVGADDLDAEPLEPLHRVVGRYGGDDAVDVVVDAGRSRSAAHGR